MKVRDLVTHWQTAAVPTRGDRAYQLRLAEFDAARIAALRDMFPDLDDERILADLVAAALNDLMCSFAYEPGGGITGYDEHGEPRYGDSGLAPRFQRLAMSYVQQLENTRKHS